MNFFDLMPKEKRSDVDEEKIEMRKLDVQIEMVNDGNVGELQVINSIVLNQTYPKAMYNAIVKNPQHSFLGMIKVIF